ncbi:S9 family peptidase [Sporosarcina oncorhynchi]|uniref:S9 family peptidase n=1 Tax=Sporosarcina oncorhynchi TaxID=3056444 RepID=A0ABZ0L6J9_9BACL|nr:S9 family peptidase [Sporosarcina sp. T2O-4]WOV88125.1 S9 family peptidase [Sporosarcina sp. T2O-4]
MNVQDELIDYLTVNAAYEPAAIPTTRAFTFLTKLTGMPQLWTLDEKDEPVQLLHTHDRVLSVFHSPDGNKTVIGIDHEGNEKQQLYIVDSTGGEPQVLVESTENFHHCGGWSPDGKWIAYSSNRRHPGFFDVFIIHVETGETKQVFTYDANCVPVGWIDNESLFVMTKETNIDSTVHIVTINGGESKRLMRDGVRARFGTPVIIPGTRTGYVLTDYHEDTLYIAKFSLDHLDALARVRHWEQWDIDEMSLSPNGQALAFCVNTGGVSKLGIYYPETDSYILANPVEKHVIDSLSWLSDNKLVFGLKTPTQPGDIWTYDIQSKKMERLTFISASETVGNYWVEPELHTYKSFDGLEVPYFIYSKGEADNKPAVIYVHGGPEGQTKADYNPVLQYLVHKGFTVVAPNIRGSNGYGRKYLQLDDADKRLDAVADLASLTEELAKIHHVDSTKIGIMGRSYGGFMVLAALTHYPELWAAGVDIVGMSNLRTFLQNTGEWRRYLREFEYGSLAAHSDYFEEIAPMNLTHKITAPLLVFHGRNDTRVPVSEAEQLVRDLQERDREVELIVFEDEGHQTEKIGNHITMHTKTVAFFSRYLGE